MKTLIRNLFFGYCFLLSAFSFGQEIEWQNTIGGDAYDGTNCIKHTTDGGYIIGGFSTSNISGDKTENSQGANDFWLVKLNSSGVIEWQNTIGGSDFDVLYSVSQTTDGGYVCGGASKSNITGEKTENSHNNSFDYWVVKVDSSGNILWQKTIGGDSDERLTAIQQTNDGGYILGGYSYSDISGEKSENNWDTTLASSDYWIVKIDSNGNIQWQNTIGGTDSDYLQSIEQTSDNGYILGGTSISPASGDKSENTTTSDYWIIKTDSSGNIQWENTIGGNYVENLYCVRQTNDGGYVLGGSSWSTISGDKTLPLIGNTDFWLVKINATGNILWQNAYGGTNHDQLNSVQQTSDGGYFLGGSSWPTISGGTQTENTIGQKDYWVVKTDATGNLQWQNSIGGKDNDELYYCEETSDGYILAGQSFSNTSGDKTEDNINNPNNSLTDIWVVKLNSQFNLISGNLYLDLNSNNIPDSSDIPLRQKKVIEQNTGRMGFSNQNGFYYVSVLDSGNYTVTPSPMNLYSSNPPTQNVVFSGFQETDSLNDFAFQPLGVFNDLCVTITPISSFRTGSNGTYIINYENYGNTFIGGDVIFFPDNNVSYVSSSTTPTSISTDSIVWNTGVLTPFQSGSITVTVNVNTGLPIGTLVNSSVRIEPIANDANPGCNYHSWEVYTIGSYDPNDILVSEDTLFTTQLPSQPWLDYTIRFQNTGNDTAFTVNVLNPIDTTKLELSSIEFVNSSHPVNLTWKPWERNMEFKFNNILLPDSNINEPLSHGFVHYRIKPKTTLLAGDSITNNANIYFDFNAPVATNTAVTRIVLPTGISNLQFTNYDLKVFPNPAKDEITIAGYALQNNQPAVLKIYDIMGKEVFSQSFLNQASQIVNLKSFTSGVYFVQLQTGAKVSRVKFVKQ